MYNHHQISKNLNNKKKIIMSKNINIVTTNFLLRHFRQIDIFKVDLGFSLKQKTNKPGEVPKLKIKDNFVKQYESINRKFIHKYGQIGSIIFYEDQSLPRYEFHIYKDEKVYEIEMLKEDFKKAPDVYLTEILKMLDEETNNEVDEETNMIKNVVYTTVPDDVNIPSQKLEKDQYIEALVKRRQTIEKLRNQNK